MQNGNTFINEGSKGGFFEVTPEGEIAWKYSNPYRVNINHPDGNEISTIPFAYWQIRANFIPMNRPSPSGKELKPLDSQLAIFKLPPKPKNESD
jgi:hypothetical protein